MRPYFCTVILLGLVVNIVTAEKRTWTSANGSKSVEATFLSFDGTTVRLKKANGNEIDVPAASLSEADQSFLSTVNTAPASNPGGGMTAALRQQFEALGLRVASSELVLIGESAFSKELSGSLRLQRKLIAASKKLEFAMRNQALIKRGIGQLRAQNVQFNTQLARVSTVAMNNKLVGALNANGEKIELAKQQLENLGEHITKVRAEVSKEREAYLQHVLNLRQSADELRQSLEDLAGDAPAVSALEQLNHATGKEYAFTPSRSFLGYLKRLKSIEDTVLSESIPLRREPSGTLYVSTMVNGEHSREMVLDSGASLTSLPRDVASALGIEVSSSDPDITLTLADGRQIRAKLVRLASLRVGKFQVDDVEAAVLGPEATNAEPLLGMSFLDNFKFEVNAVESKLTMVKVDTPGAK